MTRRSLVRFRLRDVLQKTGPVFLANTITRASSTLVFIIVARRSGPGDAGALSLATGYLAILTTLFLGLDDVLIREIAKRPRRLPLLVASYGVIRVPLTLAACLSALMLMRTSDVTSQQALAMRIIVATALIDVLAGLGQAVLLGLRRPEPLVYPAVLGLVLRSGVGWLLMIAAGLVALSIVWPVASLVTGIMLVSAAIATARETSVAGRLHVARPVVRFLARALPGFGAISLLSALEYQVDVILLSVFRSAPEVGIYSSAASILYVAALVPQAYRPVIFTEFVRTRNRPRELSRSVRRATATLVLLGVLMAIAGSLIAPLVIPLVFGPRFILAAPVIRVLIWNIVFMCANVPLVRYLMATGYERYVWQTLVASSACNLAVNLVLIPPYGAVGASVARLCSSILFTSTMALLVLRQTRRAMATDMIEANNGE